MIVLINSSAGCARPMPSSIILICSSAVVSISMISSSSSSSSSSIFSVGSDAVISIDIMIIIITVLHPQLCSSEHTT